MIPQFSTKIKQIVSQAFGGSNRKRRGHLAGQQLGFQSLEPRKMLTAATWTAADVGDEAEAFFDDSYVHDIYITFDDADWYNTLYNSHANDVEDPYFAADFSADGVVIADVGVRFKGNSSFDGDSVKKSIKIDFDEFDEDNDELDFFGLKKLNLNNNHNDPSQIREKLFLDYASNFVDGVSRAVHTNVFINGELWGLYTAVEQVDQTFIESRYGSDEDGTLFKGAASDDAGDDPQADFGSDLTYLGADPEPYYEFYQLKTNETANDYSQLIEVIDVLNNTATEDLPAAIEPLLDVQDTLAGMALNNLFANTDSYSGSAHNYYLYDQDGTGQFSHIFWDVNESFGTFAQFVARNQDMTELDPFWTPVATGGPGQTEPEVRPLMENLWAVDDYSADYLRDLAEMIREGFNVTSASVRINELADLIRADVNADPNKQFTSAQFETNLNSNVANGNRNIYGLTSFIGDRSAYLNNALDTFASTSDLVINELMSVNVATVQDEAGDFDPWVEIYNFGPGVVDTTGLYLTDDSGDLTKWSLNAGDLDDGEFLTLWIDGETGEGSNHVSFSLDANGGTLQLTDGVSVIDSVTYDAITVDMSLARIADGDGDFETTDQPTFGSENLASVVVVEPVTIYINEFLADNDTNLEDPDDTGSFDDWLELYNPGTEAVDLSGMYLTDALSDSTQWQFADGTTIAAGGYLLIWADDDTEQGDNHTSFKLSASGEEIGLYHIDGTTLIDSVVFGAQATDVSYGRFPDGSETFVSMATPTPGAANVVATGSPQVTSAIRDGGSISRPDLWSTIAFEFSGDVNVTDSALSLQNDSIGGALVDLSGVTMDYDTETSTATWDLSNLSTPLSAAFYTVTLDSNLITGVNGGQALDGNGSGSSGGNHTTQIYQAIPGDANLDGSVNVLGDGFALVRKLGTNGGSVWADGDFNADGNVSVLGDGFVLVGTLGSNVIPPASSASALFSQSASQSVFAVATQNPVLPEASSLESDSEGEDLVSQTTPADSDELVLAGSQSLDDAFASDDWLF